MVNEIKSVAEFKSTTASGVTLVDFFAVWCGPCKAIAPILDALEKQYPTVNFAKVNIEAVADLAREYSISSVPTMIFFKDGDVVDIIKGANPGKVKELLEKYK